VSYTTLLVTDAGVVAYDAHRARLGPAAGPAFSRFAATAAPGMYSLTARAADLDVTPRPGTRLRAGLPLRLRPSPIAHLRGPQPKQPSPSPWDAVRAPDVITLLTDVAGLELLEGCVATLVGLGPQGLVFPPADRPRVASTAEQVLRAAFPHTEAHLLVDDALPVALVNAVALVVPIAFGAHPLATPTRLDPLRTALLASAHRR
jgi:hypothetical protein